MDEETSTAGGVLSRILVLVLFLVLVLLNFVEMARRGKEAVRANDVDLD